MRNTTKWFQGAVSAGIVVVLVVGVLFTLWRRPVSSPTGQENPTPAAQVQAPEQIAGAPPTLTPHIVVVSPLPSPPPFPTPLPTPVVTRMPVAAPPFVAVPAGEANRPYTIFFRDGNLIKTIDTVDSAEKSIVDIRAKTSLFLGSRESSAGLWGAISPDGQRLALVLTDFATADEARQTIHAGPAKGQQFRIYLLDLTTGELRLLVENARRPVWSPDGGRLAFQNTKTWGLGVVDLATGAAEEIFSVEAGSEHQADWFTWSPDGKRMAVVKTWGGIANSGGIWIVEVEKGAEARQIVDMGMNAVLLEWSPDGAEILFLSDRGDRSTPERPTNIWSVNVETGAEQQLTKDISASAGVPVWSPDSKWIAFAGTNMLEAKEYYQYDLWLLSSNGNMLIRLTDDPITDLNPTWTPSGAGLVFNKEEQGLWELDLISGATKQLVPKITSYWFLH
ncbi:MAG: PD40 domain-containing protein [Caldilineaceae bacterium]|jgi:Tol biopolymer transport system component|nr:PD40 domain-containing protein [Caldilineaceae bacterium]